MKKYIIFTDGAVDLERSLMACAFLVRTDTEFIDLKAFSVPGNKITHAETHAIGLAAEYMLKNVILEDDDEVTIYTDSKMARDFLNEIKDKQNAFYKDVKTKFAIRAFCGLREKVSVKLKLTKAHKGILDENSVVDRYVKYALKVTEI